MYLVYREIPKKEKKKAYFLSQTKQKREKNKLREIERNKFEKTLRRN